MKANYKAKLIEMFMKHPGETLFLGDVAEDVGLSKTQVQNSIANMLRTGSLPGLMVVNRGNSWAYKPQTTARRLFEELAETKTGDLVLQDSDGALWRAKPLD